MARLCSSCVLIFVAIAAACAAADDKPKRPPDVPYEPTHPEIVSAMLKLADVRKSDVVYDLGCGDGRIVIEAAKQFGARGVGIDIDPQRIREARANARQAGVGRLVTFRIGDLFQAKIREATVVMLYLWPEVNLKLRPKLLRDLKPGTRVVSHSHTMGDWKAEKEIEVEGDKIYLWTIPAVRK
jgi:SAM-dependent methyltransferase